MMKSLGKLAIFPETHIFALENGCLEDDLFLPFQGPKCLFLLGVNLLSKLQGSCRFLTLK